MCYLCCRMPLDKSIVKHFHHQTWKIANKKFYKNTHKKINKNINRKTTVNIFTITINWNKFRSIGEKKSARENEDFIVEVKSMPLSDANSSINFQLISRQMCVLKRMHTWNSTQHSHSHMHIILIDHYLFGESTGHYGVIVNDGWICHTTIFSTKLNAYQFNQTNQC